MPLQVNRNILVSSAPSASALSLATSSGSATEKCATNTPLYIYNSEEEYQHVAGKWEEETGEQELKDVEWIFGLQVNSGAENSEENDTSHALVDGKHAKADQPVSVASPDEGENNSGETIISETEPQFVQELATAASSRGQSIDVFSGTENIPQLNINLHESDEIFRKLQAEALEAIQASEGNAQWYWPEGFGIPGADTIDAIRPVSFNQDGFPIDFKIHGNTGEPSYTVGEWFNESSGHEQVDSEGIPTVDPFLQPQLENCEYITPGHESQFPPTFNFPQQAIPSTDHALPVVYFPQTYIPQAFDLAAIPPSIQYSINNPLTSETNDLPAEEPLQPLQESSDFTLTGDISAYTNGDQDLVPDNTQWVYPENVPSSFPYSTDKTNFGCGPNGNLGWVNSVLPEFVEGSSKDGTLSLSNQNPSGSSPAAAVGVDSTSSISSYVPLHNNLTNTIVPSPAQFFGRTHSPSMPYIPSSGTQRPNKRKAREDDQAERQPKSKHIRSVLPADAFPSLPAAIPHSSTSAPIEFIQGATVFSDHARIPPQTPTPRLNQSRHPVPYKLENGRYKCIYTGPASKNPFEECGQTSTAHDARARNRHLATHAAKEEVMLERGQITRDQAVALDWATRTTVKCDKPGCGFSVAVWRTDNVRRKHNEECHPEDALAAAHPLAGLELTDWQKAQLRSMCQIIHDAADRMGFQRP